MKEMFRGAYSLIDPQGGPLQIWGMQGWGRYCISVADGVHLWKDLALTYGMECHKLMTK